MAATADPVARALVADNVHAPRNFEQQLQAFDRTGQTLEAPSPASELVELGDLETATGELAKVGATEPQIVALSFQVRQLLTKVNTVPEALLLCGAADAVKALAKAADVTQKVLLDAACDRIRSEYRLGALFAKLHLASAAPGNQHTGKLDRLHAATGPKTLAELGLEKTRSSRLHALVKATPEEMEAWLSEKCKEGKLPTLKAARDYAKNANAPPPTPPRGEPAQEENEANDGYADGELLGLLENASEHVDLATSILEPILKAEGGELSFKPVELSCLRNIFEDLKSDIERSLDYVKHQ